MFLTGGRFSDRDFKFLVIMIITEVHEIIFNAIRGEESRRF